VSILVIVVAAGLVGLAAGVAAGPWGWLAIMAFALVVYISVGTGRDVPPDWMATAVPAIPFAFIGVGIGISVRRAVRGDTSFASAFLAARPQSPSRPQELPSADDLAEALGALSLLLESDFDGADAYRRQLDAATLTRHAAGYRIAVDRSRAAPAEFDARRPGGRLPVEANGEDNVRIWLHGIEGYLDDLELLNASRFPHPATLQVRSMT
jgi:hypothetical protein